MAGVNQSKREIIKISSRGLWLLGVALVLVKALGGLLCGLLVLGLGLGLGLVLERLLISLGLALACLHGDFNQLFCAGWKALKNFSIEAFIQVEIDGFHAWDRRGHSTQKGRDLNNVGKGLITLCNVLDRQN